VQNNNGHPLLAVSIGMSFPQCSKYPEQIRQIIYTTNAIENFNRQPSKVTKIKERICQ
jgi:hypothetical protein